TRVRRRLAALRREERELPATPRRARSLEELDALERRVARMLRAEPLAAAAGEPPPGLASPQLVRAPGYREAHRACLLLRLGLSLEGGPVRLAVKDLSLLYEYWCFLALARILAARSGSALPARGLLAVEERGLRVLLRRGREQALKFDLGGGTRAVLTYNPRFGGEPLLVPQQPDLLLEVRRPDGTAVRVVLDAKYRVAADAEYVARYGSPGPPEDALNVLHRYRDAIVRPRSGAAPERIVARAAALFPFREAEPGAFRASRLWRSLDGLAVGAIPLLPGSTEYLEAWVDTLLAAVPEDTRTALLHTG
ncbi:MAG: nuclease domain-containing protein, partial [Longimicrobiaceae bacterium]